MTVIKIKKFLKKRIIRVYLALFVALFILVVSIVVSVSEVKKESYPPTSLANNSYFLPQSSLDGDKKQEIKVDSKTFQLALKEVGATSNSPLSAFIKLSDPVISDDKQAWLNALKQNATYVSNNLINIGWESKNGTQIPLSSWKVNGNSPMGYMSWSPDYNAAGTWFEPFFLINKNGQNANSYWSAWPSLLRYLYHNYKTSSKNELAKEGSYYDRNGKLLSSQDIMRNLVDWLETNHVLAPEWYTAIENAINNKFSTVKKQDWMWNKIAQRDGPSKGDIYGEDGLPQTLSGTVGLWVNQDDSHAQWLEQFLDSEIPFIPLSVNQYGVTTGVRRVWLWPRDSSVSGVNYRDYGVDNSNLTQQHNSINLANQARIFDTIKTPLNPCFQDWPIDIYFGSTLETLTSWVTSGNISGINDNGKVIQPQLKLQASTSVGIYYHDEKSPNKDDEFLGTIDGAGSIDLNNPNLLRANRYEFKIDPNIQWVNQNGKPMQKLNVRDFIRGWISYWLASDSGLCVNGYFLSLIGLDTKKTFGIDNILDPQINFERLVNDVAAKNKEISKGNEVSFNVYLKKPYPLFLDIISKENFACLPYTNKEVKNIAIKNKTNPEGVVVLNDYKQIDLAKTNFSQIFGAGSGPSDYLNNYWSAGPYTINNITGSQIVFQQNVKGYWDDTDLVEKRIHRFSSLKKKNDNDPIQTVVFYYGTGNETVFYEKFLAKQLDYVKFQTMSQIMNAERNSSISQCVFNFTPAKTALSVYILFTGRPYTNRGGVWTKQTNLTQSFYNMMEYWNDERDSGLKINGQLLKRWQVSKIIRSGLIGLINYAQLGRIQNSSGSFQYSIIPYGVMNINTMNDKTKKVESEELYHYIVVHPNVRQAVMPIPLKEYLDGIDNVVTQTVSSASFNINVSNIQQRKKTTLLKRGK